LFACLCDAQMGRGRTTTGMVIATLLCLRKVGAFPLKKLGGVRRAHDSGA
jgi:hypothetical protein